MVPSELLAANWQKILQLGAAHHTAKPRVCGSVLGGEINEISDLDLLVDTIPGATLFDLGGIQMDLKELLGTSVVVLSTGDRMIKSRQQVLHEARPL